MKAILVIDMPEEHMGSVIDVKLYGKEKVVHEHYVNKLIPLLKQFTMDEILMAKDVKTAIEMRAYNDRLEDIMGETE